jgi:hypothetical protein
MSSIARTGSTGRLRRTRRAAVAIATFGALWLSAGAPVYQNF